MATLSALLYYAVIGGRSPGIVRGWPEAHKRRGKWKGAYVKKFGRFEDARRYYEEVTGVSAPLVLGEVALDGPPQDLPRIKVETETGVVEVTLDDEQIAGLKRLDLWP